MKPEEHPFLLLHRAGCGGPALLFRRQPVNGEVMTTALVAKLDGSDFVDDEIVLCGNCGETLVEDDLGRVAFCGVQPNPEYEDPAP